MPLNTMTFHIALSSIPPGNNPDEKNTFMDAISGTYANLKQTIKEYYREAVTTDEKEEIQDFTYIPAKYYLLGTYDAAFITLVDRFKFSQRLIQPLVDQQKADFSYFTNSFQIISGITTTDILAKSKKLPLLFADSAPAEAAAVSPAFLTICNIKLNNSLLIGNGNQFIEAVQIKIQEMVDETFGKGELTFIMQSFSWFEITLLMFIDDIDKVSNLLFRLRKLRINQLPGNDILSKQSLYKNLPSTFSDQTDVKIQNSHVIIDTHTYIGVHADHVEKDELFEKIVSKKYQTIDSEIEWHLKPGHLPGLLQIISEDPVVSNSFDISKISLLIGKSDYLISNKPGNAFSDNLLVFRLLIKNPALFDHIRKMKTRVYFGEIDPTKIAEHVKENNLGITRFVSELNKLAVSNATIAKINDILKSLKVSRQVRVKVVKTFHNYNNVIQNSVLYTFFLDLGHFIFNLTLTIKAYATKFENSKVGNQYLKTESIHEIESNLIELIDIFQEGYNIRVLNCYEYEEITDFDLDFNSSIEQLLTTYNSIVISIGKNVYKSAPEETVFAPIVRLNLKNTVSNYDSINYSVYNFLAPEFIFFTMLKEALNHFKHNSTASAKIEVAHQLFYQQAASDGYLQDLLVTNSLDFYYYYIDAVRYELVCNHDFPLFYYWFWTTNFQNASLYDPIGIMKEKHFKTELFRIMFIARLFGEEVKENQCPIPTLENYWERYYLVTKKSVAHLFTNNELAARTRTLVFDEIGDCLNKFSKFSRFTEAKPDPAKDDVFYTTLSANIQCFATYFPNEAFQLGRVHSRLQEDYIPNYSGFLQQFYKQHKKSMREGKTPVYQPDPQYPPNLYLYGLMHAYLRLLYELNDGKINYLYRSWEDGKPMHSFINIANKDALCFIDQTGSIFFLAESKANSYFTMRNGVLLTLMDFADKYKVDLFADIVSRSEIFNQ